jgi:hypothetical protein
MTCGIKNMPVDGSSEISSDRIDMSNNNEIVGMNNNAIYGE